VFKQGRSRFRNVAEWIRRARRVVLRFPKIEWIATLPAACPYARLVVGRSAFYADTVRKLASSAATASCIRRDPATSASGGAACNGRRCRGHAVVGDEEPQPREIVGARRAIDYTAGAFTESDELSIRADAVGETTYFSCRKL